MSKNSYNNSFMKSNISKILSIFILLSPFIDLFTGIFIHSLNINFTIGIIIRILFLIFICFITLFTFKKKNILIPYLIIGIYFICYIVVNLIYKDSSILKEIQELIKVFYFPIVLVSLYSIKEEIHISRMTLFTTLFMYLILIFVPIFFNVGYKTYEITKAGTLGFFNSANEISGIIAILTPIMFIILIESKNLIPKLILGIMYLVVILMMGTKTPLLSLGITLIISIIYYWTNLVKNKKYKKVFLSLFILILGISSLIIIIPRTNFYKNIETHLHYLKLNSITEVFKSEKYVDHFIFSSRLKFLRNKAKIYNKSNIYEKLFGIGYINNNKLTKSIEMDYFDIYFSHGIIGFIIYFSISIYILIKILSNKINKSYQRLMYETSLFLIIILSLFTGHILTAPSPSILVIIIVLSLNKKHKKRLLFTDVNLEIGGIEKAQINLLDNINYNKYKVDLILEEKKGTLLSKVNKNVLIKELKVSNNKNKIIRKSINLTRKLIFKILEYKNYDFSCCYTTYSYSSNKLALIASNNSSIYIHSDYKHVYKKKEDFKSFFDTRDISKFNKIIFASNEAKLSFISEYKNLENKCLVINSFINTEEKCKSNKKYPHVSVETIQKDKIKNFEKLFNEEH